ncbi:cobyrinate a,c-diamide synthase [soil metagenome]
MVTLALLRALARRGLAVASAKAGPDYIDPRFHEAASGKPCINLDPWAMNPELIRTLIGGIAEHPGLIVIEGVMGLFDGPEDGPATTAELAAMLNLPVILVIDCRHQSQSVAALVRGFASHRDDVRIAGIILNRVGSSRHEHLLRLALAPAGIPVLGVIGREADLALPGRHLGLVQAVEHPDLTAFLDRAADIVGAAVDIDGLIGIAAPPAGLESGADRLPPLGQAIAVASDAAFAFSYAHLLEGWRSQGAEIMPFSPLADEAPSDNADAVFLPGGYPELHAGTLAANARFLGGVRDAATRGALVYGECGGFMVLGRYLTDAEGTRHKMAGLLEIGTSFAERKLSLGYRSLSHWSALPFARDLRGHEFHYSTLDWQGEGEPLFQAHDSGGRDLGRIGLRDGKVMGSYAHLIA